MRNPVRSRWDVLAAAVLAATLVTVAPAIASSIVDADRLNGRPGVGCSASVAARASSYVATCARGAAAGFLPNNIIRKAVDSDKLDGLDSTSFLPVGGKASDSDKLDGLDSTSFLPVGGKASDSDKLDGLDSTDFLPVNGKASDSDLLDGIDSVALLNRSGRAAVHPGTNIATLAAADQQVTADTVSIDLAQGAWVLVIGQARMVEGSGCTCQMDAVLDESGTQAVSQFSSVEVPGGPATDVGTVQALGLFHPGAGSHTYELRLQLEQSTSVSVDNITLIAVSFPLNGSGN